MQRKLTITVDANVFEGLQSVIGPRRISRLAPPSVAGGDLAAGYAAMAADEAREAKAQAWSDALIEDVGR